MKKFKKILIFTSSIVSIGLIMPVFSQIQHKQNIKNNLSITNGQNVQYGKAPWFATIVAKTNYGANFGYGGVLINNQWVLSCGHGNIDLTQIGATLRFNMYNRLYNNYQNIVVRNSSKIIINHTFLKTALHHDLSLIKLDKPVYNVPSVNLPKANIKVGQKADVYGYGIAGVDSQGKSIFPIHLQKGLIPVLNPDIGKDFPYAHFDPLSEILAGNLIGKRIGAALADSGGPLIQFINGKPVLQGIVSRGVVPYSAGWIKAYPAIYSSVYANLNWINNTIKNN